MNSKKTGQHQKGEKVPEAKKTPGKAPGSSNTPATLLDALEKVQKRGGESFNDPYHQGRRDALMELAASGGLPQSQLGLEVLFLLPDEFVKMYSEVFNAALDSGGEAVSGKSGALGRSLGQSQGVVLGSENKLQAAGGGKKWKRPPSGGLRGEKALAVKAELDAFLAEVTTLGLRRLSEANHTDAGGRPGTGGGRGSRSSTGGIGGQERCRGKVKGRNGTVRGCGRFLKDTWNHCPFCGTSVAWTRAEVERITQELGNFQDRDGNGARNKGDRIV